MPVATIMPDGRAKPMLTGGGLRSDRTYPVHIPQHRGKTGVSPQVGARVHVQICGLVGSIHEPKVRIIG